MPFLPDTPITIAYAAALVVACVLGLRGGPDISAALFSPTTLRIGERPTGQTPANGTIHHVVLASGAQSQAQLNALCAAVHALPVS